MLRIVFISLFLSFAITFLVAQPTFSENNINSNHDQANMVWAIDVDNDGDTDIVSAAHKDDDVTWWENNGTGNFTERTIDGSLNGAWEIRSIDLE